MKRSSSEVLALALVFIITNTTQRSPEQATVRGLVTDFAGARVQAATLRFLSDGPELRTQTGTDGSYSIRLKPGSYTLLVVRDGFCPARRGLFTLEEGAEVEIDAQLILCTLAHGLEFAAEGTVKAEFSRYQGGYESEELNAPTPSLPRPLAMFGCRRQSGPLVRFTGLVVAGKYVPVVLTFGLYTLRANSLDYRPGDGTYAGEGDVLWQDGKISRRGSRIQVTLRGPTPEVALTE